MNVFEQNFDFLFQSLPPLKGGEKNLLNNELVGENEDTNFSALFKQVQIAGEFTSDFDKSDIQDLQNTQKEAVSAESILKDGKSMPPFLMYQLGTFELSGLNDLKLSDVESEELSLGERLFSAKQGNQDFNFEEGELDKIVIEGNLGAKYKAINSNTALFDIDIANDYSNIENGGLRFSLLDKNEQATSLKGFDFLLPLDGFKENDVFRKGESGLEETSKFVLDKSASSKFFANSPIEGKEALWAAPQKLDELSGKLSKEFEVFAKGYSDEKSSLSLSELKNIGKFGRENAMFEKLQSQNYSEENVKQLKSGWLNLRGVLVDTPATPSLVAESGKNDNLYTAASVSITGEDSASTYLTSSRAIESVQELKGASSLDLKSGLNVRSQFSPDLSARIQWMMRQSLSSAEILMDPPELGPMTVKVQQHNGELNVLFHVTHSSTRDALEDNMARLKALLQEQGIMLGDAQVQQEDKSQSQTDQNANRQALSNQSEVVAENEPQDKPTEIVHLVRNNQLDVYT